MGGADLDMVNRDPNGLNNHVQCLFEDILGEPEGVRSIDCVWRCSYKCFECCKGLCYKILTLFCGICIAMAWGCDFAVTAFNHVWIFTPCLRDFAIAMGCLGKISRVFLDCCCSPVCEACGMCLSNIRIKKS